jgi:hypothetical protein
LAIFAPEGADPYLVDLNKHTASEFLGKLPGLVKHVRLHGQLPCPYYVAQISDRPSGLVNARAKEMIAALGGFDPTTLLVGPVLISAESGSLRPDEIELCGLNGATYESSSEDEY